MRQCAAKIDEPVHCTESLTVDCNVGLNIGFPWGRLVQYFSLLFADGETEVCAGYGKFVYAHSRLRPSPKFARKPVCFALLIVDVFVLIPLPSIVKGHMVINGESVAGPGNMTVPLYLGSRKYLEQMMNNPRKVYKPG